MGTERLSGYIEGHGSTRGAPSERRPNQPPAPSERGTPKLAPCRGLPVWVSVPLYGSMSDDDMARSPDGSYRLSWFGLDIECAVRHDARSVLQSQLVAVVSSLPMALSSGRLASRLLVGSSACGGVLLLSGLRCSLSVGERRWLT